MGTSTDAVLAYGFDLGSSEDAWKVEETDEYGALCVEWFDETSESRDDDKGFAEVALMRLLAAHGFTETDWQRPGYFGRRRQAEESLGIEIETYCSGDFPMFILAAKVITVGRGHSEILDMAALQRLPQQHDWDDKLRAAMTTLGLTPKQENPGWILCSYWG